MRSIADCTPASNPTLPRLGGQAAFGCGAIETKQGADLVRSGRPAVAPRKARQICTAHASCFAARRGKHEKTMRRLGVSAAPAARYGPLIVNASTAARPSNCSSAPRRKSTSSGWSTLLALRRVDERCAETNAGGHRRAPRARRPRRACRASTACRRRFHCSTSSALECRWPRRRRESVLRGAIDAQIEILRVAHADDVVVDLRRRRILKAYSLLSGNVWRTATPPRDPKRHIVIEPHVLLQQARHAISRRARRFAE